MILILVKLSECMLDISVFCKEYLHNVYITEEWKKAALYMLEVHVHIVCITLSLYNNQGVTLTFPNFRSNFSWFQVQCSCTVCVWVCCQWTANVLGCFCYSWPFIWTNLNPLHQSMFCANLSCNLPSDSGEDF